MKPEARFSSRASNVIGTGTEASSIYETPTLSSINRLGEKENLVLKKYTKPLSTNCEPVQHPDAVTMTMTATTKMAHNPTSTSLSKRTQKGQDVRTIGLRCPTRDAPEENGMRTMLTEGEDVSPSTLALAPQENGSESSENYFLRIAMAARARGFAVTPLRGKRPLLHAWNKHPLTTETEIRTAAKEYPSCDVGVVLKRRVGEPFAIDVDAPAVVERMEAEAGKTLPETYMVLSRPETARHKRHIFFRHTLYSYSVFDKNVNAGEYDLVGTGTRALQVVAEGCVRPDTGEVRTGNGLPIADCPDWVADWLVADSKRLLAQKAADTRRKNAELKRVLKEIADYEAAEHRARTGYVKHARPDRYRYLVSKAKTLHNAGVAKDRLMFELLAQYVADYGEIRDDDADGWPLAELKEKIQSIINNPEMKRGNPPPIRPRQGTGLVLKRSPESAWERRVKMARAFPESMKSPDVYTRLGLDSKKRADKKVVSRVMKAAGFVAKRGRRSSVWEKIRNGVETAGREGTSTPLSLTLPHHTDSVTVTPES
jgi:hypothetical protein